MGTQILIIWLPATHMFKYVEYFYNTDDYMLDHCTTVLQVVYLSFVIVVKLD